MNRRLQSQTRRQQQGFTLIELLVVISIIVLLISILLPSLAAARQAANQTKCLSNLKTMGTGSHMYFHDFKDYIYPHRWTNSGLMYWFSIMWPYAGGTSYVWNLPPHPEGGYVEGLNTAFRCPSDTTLRPAYAVKNVSYSVGWYLTIDMHSTGTPATRMGGKHRLRRVPEFTRASSVGIIGDWDPLVDSTSGWQGLTSTNRQYLSLPMWMRHGQGQTINYTFLDGHAANVRRPDQLDFKDDLFTGGADPMWN